MKKAIIITILLIIVGAGVYFYSRSEVKAPTSPAVENGSPQTQTSAPQNAAPSSATSAAAQTGTPAANYTPPQAAGGGENTGSNIQVYEVDFDGTKFSPSPITVNVKDWIFFRNKGQVNMWIISNPGLTSPTDLHLDSLKAIPPGGEYKFQFTSPGDFIYENKLNPPPAGSGGTVIVSK